MLPVDFKMINAMKVYYYTKQFIEPDNITHTKCTLHCTSANGCRGDFDQENLFIFSTFYCQVAAMISFN